MGDFLHENNTCGHNILCLVSRGNAIIAEIFRLKEFIPPVYRLDKKPDLQKYGELLLDFSFFKQMEEFEKKLDANELLRDLDDEVRDNNLETVTRFYLLFESIHKYITDLNRFVQDLEEGLYIQQTIETVFVTDDGKQLMCEALYLCGAMLLLVDQHIDGPVRERLLVSYFRYSAQRASSDCYVDDVCQLLRSTSVNMRRPPDYPEAYFKRASVNELFVRIAVGRLRADDVYHQLKVFPLPEHRSTALATQAAMLFISLFFQPAVLHSQTAAMREIVDKYFPDNWIVSLYMGEIMSLAVAWEPFKAARTALANTLESSNVETVAARARDQLQKLLPNVKKLNEDRLGEQQLLDNSQKVLSLVRETNVTLRWLLLHTAPLSPGVENHKRSRQLRDQVLAVTKHSPLSLFNMLLNTAEFELHVRETIKAMLTGKPEKWKEDKEACVERILEMADVFSGAKPLSRLEKNEKLQAWFKDIAKQIESLDYELATPTGRKIVHLIQALEEVQEFHGLSTHGQARQVLAETRKILHGMLRSAGLQEEVSIQLQVIADMSYAWTLLAGYAKFMQQGIKQDTGLVVKLRATFLKMASALEVPLLRINQARSPDLISVSQYYSSELVALLRRVLHIIPETMFEIMANIASLQTDVIKEIPTRLDKDELKEYAQLDHRFQVAKLTNDVSMLTEGITLLRSTLVGVIRIDPIQLLEDGIRCELVRHVASALDKGLTFNPKNKESDLEQKLERLGEVMEGQKRSFEYIQDYIHIYGLKIWQEELTRVIGYYVEQECNSFLRNKVSEAQSLYQSKAIPIPNFPPKDSTSVNCIGRLVREILRITDPRNAIRLDNMSWQDSRDKQEVLGLRFFGKMARAVGIPGLAGVDRLLSFLIAAELQGLVAGWQRTAAREQDVQILFGEVSKQLAASPLIANSVKVYGSIISRTSKQTQPMVDSVLKVGQMQLLRVHVAYELSSSCQFESPHLAAALETFNKAVLWDVRKHYRDSKCPHPQEDLLYSLAAQLDGVGLADSARKIYIIAKNVRYFPLISFLFTIAHLGKIVFPDASGAIPVKKSADKMDGSCFAMGLQTLLWQFHPEARGQYLTYMGQFVKSRIADSSRSKGDFSEEAVALRFLDTMTSFSKLPRSSLAAHIPQAVLDLHPAIV